MQPTAGDCGIGSGDGPGGFGGGGGGSGGGGESAADEFAGFLDVDSDGSVILTWDAPDDDSVTGYLILRRRPYEGERTLLVHVENTGSPATTFTDTDVTAGTQHVYRVKAVNEAGAGEQSNYVNVDP